MAGGREGRGATEGREGKWREIEEGATWTASSTVASRSVRSCLSRRACAITGWMEFEYLKQPCLLMYEPAHVLADRYSVRTEGAL